MAEMLRMMAVGGPFGGPLVPDYGAQATQTVHRKIGRRLDPSKGLTFTSAEIVRGPNGQEQHIEVERRHAVLVPHPEEVIFEYPANGPFATEYLRHLRDGDLIPADQATADAGARLGVSPVNGHECTFDPKFERSLHKMYLDDPEDPELELKKSADVSADVLKSVKAAIGDGK
jgi:hypothetical protein